MKKFITVLLAVCLLAALAVPSLAADDPSLLFHFKMDNGDFAKDECGNGRAQVIGDVQSAEGVFGDCAYFDGFESNVFVYSDVPNQENLTITCWARAEYFYGLLGIVVSEWVEDGDICVEFLESGGVECNNNNNPAWQKSTGVLEAETWNYITYVFDSNNRCTQIYFNGVLDNQIDYEEGVDMASLNLDSFCIGGFYYGATPDEGGTPQRVLPGGIDDVRIYGRALSAEEINTLMNGGELTAAEEEAAAVEAEAAAEPEVVEEAPAEEPEVVEEVVVEEPEIVVEEPAVVEAAPEAAAEAPQTGDPMILVSLISAIAAGAFVSSKKFRA